MAVVQTLIEAKANLNLQDKVRAFLLFAKSFGILAVL